MVGFIQRRLRTDESGFTLIELLVVMIIIAILMAVAIPLFLGQKQRALGTVAKTNNKLIHDTLTSCASDPNAPICGTSAMIVADEDSLASVIVAAPVTAANCGVGVAKPCAWITQTGGGTGVPTNNDDYIIHSYTALTSGIKVGFLYTSTVTTGTPHKTCGAMGTVTPATTPGAKAYARLCPTPPAGITERW